MGEVVKPAPLDPLDDAEIESLLLTVPPMQGAEYLSAAILQAVWRSLDDWVRQEVAGFDNFGAFLA